MNARFNLQITEEEIDDTYYEIGSKITLRDKKSINSMLKNIIQENNFIDGDMLQKTWFPDQIFKGNPYIFLSHSHADEKLAISLAGYLYENLRIQCFIDSSVWGYAGDLNAMLNNCDFKHDKICHRCNCDSFSKNISYVHMMLASALAKTIDQCESVFFLNTPTSINLRHKVDSPWIYYELNLTRTLPAKRLPTTIFAEKKSFDNNFKIEFTPPLDELICIDGNTLENWKQRYTMYRDDPYELLYQIVSEENPTSLKYNGIID